MSNVLHGNCEYFQIPKDVVKAGLLARMSVSDLRLYLQILYDAQRSSRVSLSLIPTQVQTQCGIGRNSATVARRRLQSLGLVAATRGAGNAYTYDLLNPLTGKPMKNFRDAKTQSGELGSAAKILFGLRPEQYERYYRTRLEGYRSNETSNGLAACCPFHDDRNPSMSVSFSKGVWNCRGCKSSGGMVDFERRLLRVTGSEALANIAAIVGLDIASTVPTNEFFSDEYDYCDESGELLYQVVRFSEKTGFGARRPIEDTPDGWKWGIEGVRRVLYRLPDVLRATHVIVTEGEKDVHTLERLGLTAIDGTGVIATTNPFGALNWAAQYSESLRGKSVVILGDNDEKGQEHVTEICRSLEGISSSTKVVTIPVEPGVKDVSDFLEHHWLGELVELIGTDWLHPESIIVP